MEYTKLEKTDNAFLLEVEMLNPLTQKVTSGPDLGCGSIRFFGPPDPVEGTDPDPDPSIIEQK